MFNLRSCVYALLAASAFSNVSASASKSGDSDPLPSSARTQITPIDNVLSSMFLKRSSLPLDAAIKLIPKSDLSSFPGMLRRSLFEGIVSKRSEEPSCGECSGSEDGRSRIVPRMDYGVAGVTNMDPAAWEKNVTDTCMKSMMDIKDQPNPAGMAVCYNLPFVDMGAGTFSSDLRLYKVGKASSEWASIGQNVSVSVLYDGAMVQLESTNNKRDLQGSAAEAAANSSSSDPVLLKTFHFVGQVNQENMPDGTKTLNDTMNAMKKILSPNIVLMGMTSEGTMLNTSMNTNEAAFVTGVFAAQAVQAPKTTKFVLPGTAISIVPIGLYMFSAWTFLFVAIIGWGTFERVKYRDQYRRRVASRDPAKGNPKI